jgi:hypothetical protein
MKKLLLICCCFSVLFACNEDEPKVEPIEPITPIVYKKINLSNLEVGQRSQFINYTSNCNDLNGAFTLVGDTIIVEVISENGELKFKEYFTEYSPSYLNGSVNPIIHKVIPHDNFILIPERFNSNLFFFYGNDTIHIKNMSQENMVQNNCRIDYNGSTFIGAEIGKIDIFTVGDLEYQEKTVVSCLPIWFDFDAYLIYDQDELFMSHAVNRSDNSISGWTILD